MIATAHLGTQPLRHRTNHLVGDVEAIGLVDPSQIVERHQDESAGPALPGCIRKSGFQHLGEVSAVHFASQRVEARQIGQLLFLLVPLVDDANHAVSTRGPATRVRIPAAGVLDPQLAVDAFRTDGILNLIGHAVAVVAAR